MPATPELVPDVAIHFHPADRGWANWVAGVLKSEGLTFLLVATDADPGVTTRRRLIVVSPDYLATLQASATPRAASNARDQDQATTSFAVRVRTGEPGGVSLPPIAVDLVGRDGESARTTLIGALREHLRAPAAPPTITVPVGRLDATAGGELLLRGTGSGDRAGAAALAHRLGSLPLALELASAFMTQAQMSFGEYEKLLDLPMSTLAGKQVQPPDDGAVFAAVVAISARGLGAVAPAALSLLDLCAFLASDAIPGDLFAAGAGALPDEFAAVVNDPVIWPAVRAAAQAFSLINTGNDELRVDSAIRAARRDQLGDAGRRLWAELAVNLVGRSFRYDRANATTWPRARQLLPHAITAARAAHLLDVGLDAAGRLLNQAGLYQADQQHWDDAIELLCEAVAIAERLYGPSHPTVGSVLSNLGLTFQRREDPAGARPHVERALTIVEGCYGPEHPTTAVALSNLAVILAALGEVTAARVHLQRAQAIQRGHGDHAGAAGTAQRLAELDHRLGANVGARATLDQNASLPPETADVVGEIDNLSRLAALDLQGGQPRLAREKLERALVLCEQSGHRAGETVVLSQIAVADLAENRDGDAWQRLTRCLSLQQVSGDRVGEGQSFSQLGVILARQQRPAEGIRLVALSHLLLLAAGHRSAEAAFQNLARMAGDLKYAPEQVAALLPPVADAYQEAKGWGLVRAPVDEGNVTRRNQSTELLGTKGIEFSIIIVTHNSSSVIENCLRSVERSARGQDYEIILIDNASVDATVSQVRAFARSYPAVVTSIFTLGENAGYSRAANNGLARAAGNYIVFLNPDTVVAPNWLSRMAAHFRPGVAAVGPLSNYVAGVQRIDLHLRRTLPQPAPVDAVSEAVYQDNAHVSVETKLLIGFCLMVPRHVVNEIGALDESFFIGYDDFDYCWRLRLRGHRLIVATDVFVFHVGEVDTRSLPDGARTRYLQESAQRFRAKLKQHYPTDTPSLVELFGVPWHDEALNLPAPIVGPHKLVAALLVWNDEKHIAETLRHASLYVDEIVVLDERSTVSPQ